MRLPESLLNDCREDGRNVPMTQMREFAQRLDVA